MEHGLVFWVHDLVAGGRTRTKHHYHMILVGSPYPSLHPSYRTFRGGFWSLVRSVTIDQVANPQSVPVACFAYMLLEYLRHNQRCVPAFVNPRFCGLITN